jgi:hypothetical protein
MRCLTANVYLYITTSSVSYVDSFPEGGAFRIGAERQCGTPDKRSAVRCEGPQGEALICKPHFKYSGQNIILRLVFLIASALGWLIRFLFTLL